MHRQTGCLGRHNGGPLLQRGPVLVETGPIAVLLVGNNRQVIGGHVDQQEEVGDLCGRAVVQLVS